MTNLPRLAALAALGLALGACDLSPRGPKEADVGVSGDQRRVDAQTPDRGVELQADNQTAGRVAGAERAIRPAAGPAGGAVPAGAGWPSWGATGRMPSAEGQAGPARPHLREGPRTTQPGKKVGVVVVRRTCEARAARPPSARAQGPGPPGRARRGGRRGRPILHATAQAL